jgi:hypothetical protein
LAKLLKMSDETIIPEEKGKKTIERSAAHPHKTISQSLLFVWDFYKNFRSNFAKRGDILAVIENSLDRDLACACYYSFLNRDKENYQVTDLYKSIANPISEVDRRKNLLIAFESPKLYNELIEKFDGDEVPANLSTHLIRFHRITETAAPNAANVFIENAKYVGVLNKDNILHVKQMSLKLDDPEFVFAKDIIEPNETERNNDIQKPTIANPLTIPVQPKAPQPQLLLNEINTEEKLTIKLSEKKLAYLLYPTGLNEKDIKILKMQIEALELTL